MKKTIKNIFRIALILAFIAGNFAHPRATRAAEIAQYSGGLLVYADGTVGTPKYRVFDDTTGFGAEQSASSVGANAIVWLRVAASPINDEWIIATKDSNGVIKAQVCTGVDGGVSCGTPTTITSSGNTAAFRNFDVAYEYGSGDALLVYGTATADELRKIEWTGGSWTGDAAITTTRTSGTVEWVELTSRGGTSDQIGIAYSDTNDDVSAYRWSGTAVADEATAAITATAPTGDVRKMDVSFEGTSGDMLVAAWVSGARTIAYGALSGTTWTITTNNVPDVPSINGLDLAEPPPSGDVIGIEGYGVLTASNTTEGLFWSGTAMTDSNFGDALAGNWTANAQLAAVSYMSSTYLAVAVLSPSTGADDIGWWTLSGTTVTEQAVNTRTRGATRFVDLFDYPNADKVLLITADANSDLWADTWDGASVSATAWTDLTSGGALEIDLASATTDVVDFAFRLAPIKTTTLGNGTNPGNATIGPGGAATEIDSFTFQTNTGTDVITSVTTTLAANTTSSIAEVAITSDNGTTVYGSSTNPTANSFTITLNQNTLTANTTQTQYKIRITPKSHANMPAPPGSTYTVTSTITAWSGTNTQAGSDTNSATITIDNESPNGATGTSGSAGNAKVTLNWTTSNSADFDGTNGSVILRWASSTIGSEVPAEGNSSYAAGNTIGTATVACVISSASSTAVSKIDGSGGDTGCTTSSLTNGQPYSYRVFQRDTRGNYDVGVTIGTFTPLANVAPTVSVVNVTPDPIVLTENTTTIVTITASINDDNGCDDVFASGTITAVLYRSGVGASCTADDNNCYRNITLSEVDNTCTGGADNSGDASGTVAVWYFAEPTDASSTFSAQTWQAEVKAVDFSNGSSTATDSGPPDLNTLWAIDVTANINYGTVNPNEDTSSTNQTATIKNTGNAALDVEVSGTDMTFSSFSIAVGNQKYATSTFTYTGCGICTALSTTPTAYEVDLPKPTSSSTPVTDDIFWGLGVPIGRPSGTYNGSITFTAIGD